MQIKSLKISLVKLPTDIELVLYLIREELKNNRLFTSLAKAGLRDSHFQSNFCGLVLVHSGFDDDPDDLYEFYYSLINEYTEKIEADNDVITECAFEVYVGLMIEKKRRQDQK